MRWFYNMKAQNKFFAGFGLITMIVVSVALAGYQGLSVMNRYLTELHDEHFTVAISLAETGVHLNAVRATLLGMMAAKGREDQEKLHAGIKQLTKKIDDSFQGLLNGSLSEDAKGKIRKVQEPWVMFRDTRDNQLIPAIYEGRLDEARTLATGIQAERFRLFSDGAAQLIKGAQEQALRFKEEGKQRYGFSVGIFVTLSGLAIFLGIALAFLYTRFTALPLREAVDVLEAVASGDITRRLEMDTKDEVGQMATALNQALENMNSTIHAIARNAQSVATSSEELTAVSHQMSSNSEETAAQANVVSAASEQVSKNVQTVAAGTEQMGASIKEIAKNTSEAARVAKEAVEVAEKTNRTITKLGDSSAEIGNVIKVITSIAEQTNLLALNATIEAARAGEAGKGFAVVANEVKELAKQTAQATEDIGNKIKAIQGSTQESVAAIGRITEVINQVNDIANTIASAVEEQSVTTNEMSRNVTEAAKGSNEIVQNITGVAQAAQSTASGATQTQAAAQELARMANELQSAVNQFKVDDEKQEITPAAKERAPRTEAPRARRRPPLALKDFSASEYLDR